MCLLSTKQHIIIIWTGSKGWLLGQHLRVQCRADPGRKFSLFLLSHIHYFNYFLPRLALNSETCLPMSPKCWNGRHVPSYVPWQGDFAYNGYESTKKCITYYCQFLNGDWGDMIHKDIGRPTMVWHDNEGHGVPQYDIRKRRTTKSSSALNPLVMS